MFATLMALAVGWGGALAISRGVGELARTANGGKNLLQTAAAILPAFSPGKTDYAGGTAASNNSPDKTITVIIGGDIMMDRAIRRLGEIKGYDTLFAEVAPTFRAADIAVANLEGPITAEPSKTLNDRGATTDSFAFTFAPETAGALARAGLDAVSMANNHSDNFGASGIEQTRKYLSAAGVEWFGTPWNATSSEAVICKKGVCVALVGYHAFQSGFERIVSRVQELKAKGDFVVVMPHWGVEYSPHPTDTMRKQARELAAAGAGAIVGAHSHVIGDNEWLGEVPVYYSLGNLLFDQYFSAKTMEGLLVELYISPGNGKPTLDHVDTLRVKDDPGRGIILSDVVN